MRVRARQTGRAWAAVLLVGALVVGCGQVSDLAAPQQDVPVSAVPTGTATPPEDAAAGISPATVTPTPTPTPTDPTGGGGGGGGGGGVPLGDTVLSSGSPTRVSFGMHVLQLDAGAWPTVPVGSFRIWNGDSTWGALEPAPGDWRFDRLDARVDLARSRGSTVMLVLAQPPAWAATRPDLSSYGGSPSPPKDMAQWRNYVTTVASRYAGRIEAYEIWNEPNLSQFFVGSPQQLGELTKVAAEAINAVDPAAKVVSAGFSARTGGAESYFRAYVGSGIGPYIDVVGIHIYPFPGDGPESMVSMTRRFRAIADGAGLGGKPMWNTEIGYGRTPDAVISDTAAASLVLRTFLVLPAAGLLRNYWYMWDDREFVGLYLVGPDRRSPTAAGYRFGEAQRWVANSDVEQCSNGSGAVWTCVLRHPDGPTVTIAWSLAGEVAYPVPAGTTLAYRFGGDRVAATGGSSFTLGSTPVLFAPSALPSLS